MQIAEDVQMCRCGADVQMCRCAEVLMSGYGGVVLQMCRGRGGAQVVQSRCRDHAEMHSAEVVVQSQRWCRDGAQVVVVQRQCRGGAAGR